MNDLVKFTEMKYGDKEDYLLLQKLEKSYVFHQKE